MRVASVGGTEILVSYTTLAFAGLFAVILGPQVEAVSPGLGPLRYVAGAGFAVLVYLAVLLHEVSHAVVARAFGVVVPSITLHFMGGMTAVQGEARSPRQELLVAVVGPLTSLAVGGAAYLGYRSFDTGLLGLALFGLAVGNLLIGVLNLVPGLPLDGGRVLKAVVWSISGSALRGVVVAARTGRVVAVLLLAWPLLSELVLGVPPSPADYLLAFLLAAFMWTTAGSELASARLRSKLPALVGRDLARRAVTVSGDLPLAEAVRRARESQAGGIVVTDSAGLSTGVVSEAALLATPDERRPWVPVSSVTRNVGAGLRLPVGIAGESLVAALGAHPAQEYVLLAEDGSVYGVLATADVDRALRGAATRRTRRWAPARPNPEEHP